jgi:hypothetical protein
MAKPVAFTPNLVLNGGINKQVPSTELADNQWLDGLNVEPLPDGFRRRKGYANDGAFVLGGVNQSSLTGSGTRTMVDGTAEIVTQSFQVPTATNVTSVQVRLKNAGSTVTPISARLWGDTAGAPNTGDLVGSFDDFDSTLLTASYAWITFIPAAASSRVIAIDGTTTYHFALLCFNQTVGNEPQIETDAAGAYGSGQVHIDDHTGGSFTASAAEDINFRVFTGPQWVTGIHDYSLSDAINEYHLMLAGQHVWKVAGTTYTPLNPDDPYTTYGQNVFPSMVTANDRVLIAHGANTVSRKFYLLSGTTEYWENEGILAPTATHTTSLGGAGDPLPAGTYEIDYYYWNDDLGIASKRRYDGDVAASATETTSGAEEIDIASLPGAVARTGDRATHVRIEIKEAGDLFFRYVHQVAIADTTATITGTLYAAAGAEAEYNDDVPPQHTMKAVVENRQFIAGNSTTPWRLHFSKLANGVPYHEPFPTNNTRDFGRGDGDYITALAFLPPRLLVVGFKNSIWAIDARNPGTSDRQKIADGIGIASHNSFVVHGSTLYFLSDSDRHKGFFKWGAGNRQPEHLAAIDDPFQTLNLARLKYASSALYTPDDNRHQFWTTMSSAAQTAHDVIYVYDFMLDAWTIYNSASNILGVVEVASATNVYLGQQGIEQKADSGDDDDGTTIISNLQTKHFNFGDPGAIKKLRFVEYVAVRKASGAVSLSVITDFGAGPIASTNLDYPSLGDPFTLGTSVLGGTDVLGGATANSFKLGHKAIRTVGRYLSFDFSSEDDYHFKSIALGVQNTGRR